MHRRFETRLEYSYFIVCLVLFAAASLLHVKWLWGVNSLGYFPGVLSYAALLLLLVSLLPRVSDRILKADTSFSRAIHARRLVRTAALAAICIVSLVLFFTLFSRTSLLGEGTLRLSQIGQGQLPLPPQAGDFLLHTVLYNSFFKSLGLDAIISFKLLSVVCGAIFMVGLFRLSLYLNPRQTLTTLVVLASSGVVVLFLRYLEDHALAAAITPYLVLSGLKAVDRRASPIFFLIWLYLTVAAWTAAAVWLWPALVVVLAASRVDAAGKARRLSWSLAGMVTAALVALYIARWRDMAGVGDYLLPFFSDSHSRTALLTAGHWLDVANWLGLAAIISPWLIIAARRISLSDAIQVYRRFLYALWLIVPCILFIVFAVAEKGGAREWDMFCVPTYMLIPAALILFFANGPRAFPRQVVPMAVLSLFLSIPFILVNASVTKSVERFVDVMNLSEGGDRFWDYVDLTCHAEQFAEIAERRLEFALKASEQPTEDREDSIIILSNIARMYLQQGDQTEAARYRVRAAAIDSTNPDAYVHFFPRFYLQYGSKAEKLAVAKLYETKFAQNAQARMNAGVTYFSLGENKQAGENLQRAYELDPSNLMILENFGVYLYKVGSYPQARQVLTKASALSTGSFTISYYLGKSLLMTGQVSEAHEHLALAEALAKNDEQKSQVQQLEQALDSLGANR